MPTVSRKPKTAEELRQEDMEAEGLMEFTLKDGSFICFGVDLLRNVTCSPNGSCVCLQLMYKRDVELCAGWDLDAVLEYWRSVLKRRRYQELQMRKGK